MTVVTGLPGHNHKPKPKPPRGPFICERCGAVDPPRRVIFASGWLLCGFCDLYKKEN